MENNMKKIIYNIYVSYIYIYIKLNDCCIKFFMTN